MPQPQPPHIDIPDECIREPHDTEGLLQLHRCLHHIAMLLQDILNELSKVKEKL